ncbi:MAG: hypothetical protein C0508_29195 [Cyanobacteria bacterium PR.023]|nr:hypothetical protein [Cyanobacteria bacterium PR.023]
MPKEPLPNELSALHKAGKWGLTCPGLQSTGSRDKQRREIRLLHFGIVATFTIRFGGTSQANLYRSEGLLVQKKLLTGRLMQRGEIRLIHFSVAFFNKNYELESSEGVAGSAAGGIGCGAGLGASGGTAGGTGGSGGVPQG